MKDNYEQQILKLVRQYLDHEFPKLDSSLISSRILHKDTVAIDSCREFLFQMSHKQEDAFSMLKNCDNDAERYEIERFLSDQPKLRVVANATSVLATEWQGITCS